MFLGSPDLQVRKGAYLDEDEAGGALADVKRKYYRLLKSIDVSDEQQAAQVTNIIQEVFNNMAMKCLVDSQPETDSDVARFIDNLRKLSNLHF